MLSGLTTIARAEVSLAFRRGLVALVGTTLMLGATGLGLAAAVIETSTHVGIAGALGIWGGVTFLVGCGFLMMSRSRRHFVHPAATSMAWRSFTGRVPPVGAGPVPVSGSPSAVQDAYRLGEQLGSTVSPVLLIAGLTALGMIAGRRRP